MLKTGTQYFPFRLNKLIQVRYKAPPVAMRRECGGNRLFPFGISGAGAGCSGQACTPVAFAGPNRLTLHPIPTKASGQVSRVAMRDPFYVPQAKTLPHH
jgi:hypothetical protein